MSERNNGVFPLIVVSDEMKDIGVMVLMEHSDIASKDVPGMAQRVLVAEIYRKMEEVRRGYIPPASGC
jgi:hypothetical protein